MVIEKLNFIGQQVSAHVSGFEKDSNFGFQQRMPDRNLGKTLAET